MDKWLDDLNDPETEKVLDIRDLGEYKPIKQRKTFLFDLNAAHQRGSTFGGYKKAAIVPDKTEEKKHYQTGQLYDDKDRETIINHSGNVMKNHNRNYKKAFMKATASYRTEYIQQSIESKIANPAAKYAAERIKNDEERAKKFPKPLPSKRPAQAMSGASLVPQYEDDKEEETISTTIFPKISNSHCGICDVYFCGDVPAKQHYDGQKHAKKLKKFQTDNPNSAPEQMTVERSNTLASNTALVPKTRRVEAPLVSKVGMNLEYCELCEEKLSPNPNTAFKHYSSRGHLKFLKLDADSPGLPGQSSLQRTDERRFTGTWADKATVAENPSWGRPMFNKMGHRIKLKGVGGGPGRQPIFGEMENECLFCENIKFVESRQAINHFMGKRHQTRLIQTSCQAPRKQFETPKPILSNGAGAQSICMSFSR